VNGDLLPGAPGAEVGSTAGGSGPASPHFDSSAPPPEASAPPPRGGEPRRWLLLLLAALLVGLVGLWFYAPGRESAGVAPPAGQAVIVDEEAPLAEPGKDPERDVVLFFSHEGAEGLYTERRRIYVTSSIPDQARQVIEELIRGPRRTLNVPVLPRETTLRQVYVDREGNAYVDFGVDLVERHPGGSDAELATLFAVVNSLTYNFREIRSVQLLIDGEERDTLAGHLDLRRRYFRAPALVAPEALQTIEEEG
jgi:hypothetical protein